MPLSDVFNAPPNYKYSGKGRRTNSKGLINLSIAWAKLCGKIVLWIGSKFTGLFKRKKKYSSNERGWYRWD